MCCYFCCGFSFKNRLWIINLQNKCFERLNCMILEVIVYIKNSSHDLIQVL